MSRKTREQAWGCCSRSTLKPPRDVWLGSHDARPSSCLDLLLALFLSIKGWALSLHRGPQLLLVWSTKLGPALGLQAAEGSGGGVARDNGEPRASSLFPPASSDTMIQRESLVLGGRGWESPLSLYFMHCWGGRGVGRLGGGW